MSTTEQPPTQAEGPRVTSEEARDLSRLRRTVKASPEGRHLGGVAGGLARHLDIDPVIMRVLFVVLVFFGGAGILLYVAGCLFVPAEDTDRATIELDGRTRSVVLYIAAGVSVLAILGDSLGRWDFPWPILAVGLIALVVLGRGDRFRMGQRQPAPPATWPAPAPSAAAGAVEPGDETGTTDAAAPAGPTVTMAAGAPTGPAGTAAYQRPWTGGYTPPPTYLAATPPPPNPRRRGPILFWFTLALIALLEGALGLLDVAGAAVPASGYAALAVGVTGLMLVVGAFWGRAGGLILVGLATTMWLIGSIAVQELDTTTRRIHAAPQTATAALAGDYNFGAGELVLDLTEVRDAAALDSQTLTVGGGFGEITVIVPDGWGVDASADVGVGETQLLDGGGATGGIGVNGGAHSSAQPEQPTIELDLHIGVGEIRVVHESDYNAPEDGFEGWTQR